MPTFKIVSNAPDNFQVAFRMPSGATPIPITSNWCTVDVVLPSRERAEAVIEKSKAEIELRYKIGVELLDALTPKQTNQ